MSRRCVGHDHVDIEGREADEAAGADPADRLRVRAAAVAARRLRRPTAGDLALNLAGIAVVWVAYQAARTLTEGAAGDAFANAQQVIEWQASLGIGFEGALQAATPIRLLQLANVYYLVHFPVTVTALVVTYLWAKPAIFRRLRDSLVFTTLPAVVIHAAFPLAPPRMLARFVDTAGAYGPDPYMLPGADAANQFAAMPSLHVAWAIVVAIGLWQLDGIAGVRLLAVAHVLLTPLVVVVTAHHFVVDIAAGAVVAAGALAMSHRFSLPLTPSPTREKPDWSPPPSSVNAGPSQARDTNRESRVTVHE